jgi:hypothetical protein
MVKWSSFGVGLHASGLLGSQPHSHLNSTVCGTGVVARVAEIRKRLKYSSLSAIYCFVPIAIETLIGAIGEDAADFIHRLGRHITVVSGERRATEFLLQISVAIQHHDAISVLRIAGSGEEKLDALFYL